MVLKQIVMTLMWRLQRQPLSLLYSGLLLYALLGLYWQSIRLWSSSGLTLVSPRYWEYAALLAFGLKAYNEHRWRRGATEQRLLFQPVFIAAGSILVLLSDIPLRAFGFYTDANTLVHACCLGLPAAFFIFWRGRRQQRFDGIERLFSWPFLIFCQVTIAVLFLQHVDGRMIFSDDHPSFLYRFYLLQQQFPSIPFYNPAWEAGYSAREFFASGIMNVFFLAYPLWYLGIDFSNLAHISFYNYLIPYLYLGVLPLSLYAAARLFRLPHTTAILGTLLGLGPSLGYFEWLLKYGTLGFCCSMGMIPLGVALCYRLAIDEQPPRAWHVLALLIVSYLCISWSLAGLAFLPIALYALFRYRQTFSSERRFFVIAFATLFVLGNSFWLKTFFEESKVLSFVSKTELPGAEAGARQGTIGNLATEANKRAGPSPRSELKKARALFAKINPLLLLFVFPGLCLLSSRKEKVVMASSMGFLLLLAIFGDLLKPQLELRRMIIPAAFLACLPSALALRSLLEELFLFVSGQTRHLPARQLALGLSAFSLMLGAVLLTPLTVAAVYQNRSSEQFVLAPEELEPLVGALRTYGGSGRVFFAGFILHELGASNHMSQDGGHIAPLAAFANKPLYAFYYYHSRWSTIDPIPRAYRDRGSEGIEEFLDMLHVSSVVTFKPEWARYCAKYPDRYRQVVHLGRFRLFVRTPSSEGYFFRGKGTVEHRVNGFVVTPESEEVVVKFRYLPKLRTNYPEQVELSPLPVFQEEDGRKSLQQVNFVALRVPPELLGKPITVAYRP